MYVCGNSAALLNDNPEEAVRADEWYYDVFGPTVSFVELQHIISKRLPIKS
jgi:hypothetical protein